MKKRKTKTANQAHTKPAYLYRTSTTVMNYRQGDVSAGEDSGWHCFDDARSPEPTRLYHKSTTFMDYLHGDVASSEAHMACLYEYGRESETLREAAEWRDRAVLSRLSLGPGPIPFAVARVILGGLAQFDSWLVSSPFTSFICYCRSFPEKDWNELSAEERLAAHKFCPIEKAPLPMPDVVSLKGLSVWDKFKAMADEAEPVVEKVPPGGRGAPMPNVPAMLQRSETAYYCLFIVDFSRGKTPLVDAFRRWLDLTENQKRLKECDKHKAGNTGLTGGPLDRLKDLAAWRLYRECDNNWNTANDFANNNRNKFTSAMIRERFKTEEQRDKFKNNDPMPFRDAKSAEANLFSEDADARKAKAKAMSFLTEIMRKEFPPPPGPDVFKKIEKLAQANARVARKRKNSSFSPQD